GALRGRAASLRAELARTLPEPMVPAAIVELEGLPLTPSGKLDRRALPDPPAAAGPAASPAGLSPWEGIAASVFEEVLGARGLGRDAHFFDLGGHSLLATRVVARLRRLAGVELPVRSLFEAPTVRALAARLAAARCETRPAAGGPIARVAHGGRAPVSHQQERMWFLHQLDPLGAGLTLLAGLRLRGPLDPAALRAAFGLLVERHASLRTRFETEEGRPVQAIDPPGPAGLLLEDLEPSGGEAALRERLESEASQPFDLQRGPLWRARLYRLGPGDHALCLAMHHIVTDGWSIGILVRELGSLYGQAAGGAPAPPRTTIDYADYAAWQRSWLRDGEQERQIAWWRETLRDVPALDLPSDRPRPAEPSTRGAKVSAVIEAPLAERLLSLARAEGVTLHMVLLSAYSLLLSRWTGLDDVAVGTPSANRTREETEGLIGCFVNTLVMRTRLDGEGLTWRGLLARVRETALEAYARQEVPFESVLEAVRPARDRSRSPLFQVWFNLVNVPGEAPRFASLDASPLGIETVEARFDLSLYAAEADGRIHLDAIHRTDLFEAATVRAFLDQLLLLLEQAAADPGLPLASFSLVTAAARKVLPDPRDPLPAAWRGAAHELFSRQAGIRPSAAAAAAGALDVWSYGELERRSNQLARRLIDAGAGRGEVVAILAQRAPSLAWAVLGALKSGAAFTILDPAHPAARLADCLEQARPRAIVQLEETAEPAPLPAGLVDRWPKAVRILLPRLADARARDPFAGLSAGPPGVAVGPDDPACLTFTSGSTGRPKGVLGRHGSLTHFQPYLEERFGLGPNDRFSMLSGLSHDPLQRDLFTPLACGASVRIPSTADLEAGRLAAWAAREEVSVMVLTPALLAILAAGGDDGGLPALRLAFLVGEALVRGHVERLRKLAPGCVVAHLYGTTETQRAVGHFVLPAGLPLRGEDGSPLARDAVPAGRGMPGAQMLVRRSDGGEAGLLELGEIWMRSPHLALGYLDAGLTRERFVGEGQARAYRTGDLGRCLLSGDVQVEGRRDGQLNVRGVRVEPAEVEAAVASHPGVAQVVAGVAAGGRLAAWVVPAPGARLVPAAIRESARARLPEPMVPSAIVLLDRMP
ncbi:MAG TPA: condensation domain-containing protein, partial [Candidatus Polarisedimenticolia bacterium]|nr:condensation domain-containing protein [Candidatus Polarisedimenticolia bacterium]